MQTLPFIHPSLWEMDSRLVHGRGYNGVRSDALHTVPGTWCMPSANMLSVSCPKCLTLEMFHIWGIFSHFTMMHIYL